MVNRPSVNSRPMFTTHDRVMFTTHVHFGVYHAARVVAD